MSKDIKLVAQKRDKKEKAGALRHAGFIPACMYGPSAKNEDLKVSKSEFAKVFSVAGESHLIDLTIGSTAPVKVIVKDVQRNTVNDNPIHVDFYKVDMDKKITTEIPLHFVGESKTVKELGAIIVKEIEAVKVKCLAKDLVDSITVDISAITSLDESIRLHDLKLPAGMELVSHTDEIVAAAVVQKIEVEAPVAAEVAAPAAEGEKKEEAKAETKEAPAKKQ